MTLSHALGLLTAALLFSACAEADVTLYVALDREHSEQLVEKFERESGLTVRAQFDTEANKTVGLVSSIIEERDNVQCDVFWNNELAHTVRLHQEGLLQPYEAAAAGEIPAAFKDAEGHWTGFAARARVLIVNKEQIPDPADYPTSMWDLIDPKWKGRCAIARPKTGTTLTHFVALRQVLGEQEFERWVQGLEENQVVMMQSNGATKNAVAEGQTGPTGETIAFAFTDTDDYHVALTKEFPVACVFPDQGPDQVGTMLIPNSVSIIRGAPHLEAAKKLVEFILSEEIEALLAASKSAQIPVRKSIAGPEDPSIRAIGSFKAMAWDPAIVGRTMNDLSAQFAQRFGK